MKVIFLDIDGVLNSAQYDAERGEQDGNIDVTRLELLREITEKSGAKIVLTSTWRKLWDKNKTLCTDEGLELDRLFAVYGLEIFGKTPVIGRRSEEINAWLDGNENIESFVIVDDMPIGWDGLAERLVKTDAMIGRGPEKIHAEKAIYILTLPLKTE